MKTTLTEQPAAQSGIFKIGGDMPVHRLGFGAMRLTGNGIWGEPDDPAECIAVLRRTVDLGINLIDTADSYGPFVSERLIAHRLCNDRHAGLLLDSWLRVDRRGTYCANQKGNVAWLTWRLRRSACAFPHPKDFLFKKRPLALAVSTRGP